MQDDWRANAAADAQPRPSLRLHDARRTRTTTGWRTSTRPAGTLVFASDGSLEDRALVKPDRNNFGAAARRRLPADDRTVLRGGYGIFYNGLDRIGSEDQLALNPPGLRNINQTTTSTTTPVLFLQQRVSRELPRPGEHRAEPAAHPRRQSERRERDVPAVRGRRRASARRDFVVSADFVGNFGRNIAVLRNLNQPANGNGARPYPNFSATSSGATRSGESDYYGARLLGRAALLERLQLPRRLHDQRRDGSGARASGGELGPAAGHQRHRGVGRAERLRRASPASSRTSSSNCRSAPTSLRPRPRRQRVLRGWTVSGIFTARTGRPFTVTQGGLEGATWLPNLVGDPKGQETVDSWFNVAAFQRVAAGTFGNNGRNTLRGPGYVTFDLSMQRRISMSARASRRIAAVGRLQSLRPRQLRQSRTRHHRRPTPARSHRWPAIRARCSSRSGCTSRTGTGDRGPGIGEERPGETPSTRPYGPRGRRELGVDHRQGRHGAQAAAGLPQNSVRPVIAVSGLSEKTPSTPRQSKCRYSCIGSSP